MELKASEFAGMVTAWHRKTFPYATLTEIADKLMEEAREVKDAIEEPLELPYELADVVLAAIALAGRAGIDLDKAMHEKHAINEERAKAGRWG